MRHLNWIRLLIKSKVCVGIVFSIIEASLFAQGSLLLQHFGANNPLAEGFSGPSSPTIVGPIFNDQGFNAWRIQTTNILDSALYTYVLNGQQQSAIAGSSWSLSTTLRIVQNGEATLVFYAGPDGMFNITFGFNLNGNPYVRAGGVNWTNVPVPAPLTYNNYKLIYDTDSDTASFWINNLQICDNLVGITGGSSMKIVFGQGPGPSQENWNLVSLTAIPEPATTSLLLTGGSLFLFSFRSRKK